MNFYECCDLTKKVYLTYNIVRRFAGIYSQSHTNLRPKQNLKCEETSRSKRF